MFEEILKLLPTDLGGVAAFLASIAGFAFILSFGLERWGWFVNLSSAKTKARLVFGLAFFLPIVGWLLTYALWALDPIGYPSPNLPLGASAVVWFDFLWKHLLYSGAVFAGTQYAHYIDPAAKARALDASNSSHLLL